MEKSDLKQKMDTCKATQANMQSKYEGELFDCVMGQYLGFATGLAFGTLLSLRKKRLHELMILTTTGAGLDIAFATKIACKPMIDEFESSMAVLKEKEKTLQRYIDEVNKANPDDSKWSSSSTTKP